MTQQVSTAGQWQLMLGWQLTLMGLVCWHIWQSICRLRTLSGFL